MNNASRQLMQAERNQNLRNSLRRLKKKTKADERKLKVELKNIQNNSNH